MNPLDKEGERIAHQIWNVTRAVAPQQQSRAYAAAIASLNDRDQWLFFQWTITAKALPVWFQVGAEAVSA